MDRMYRVLGFWTAMIAIMAFLGDLDNMAILFLAQTIVFVSLSYLKLSERMYMYLFGAYLTIFMAGFTYWTVFVMS
ncbi:DUF2626 domain-containing protein [Pueribacillus theae]|uniref:DUF2626 domain-containing protein n=1 Tax=Pueribacillus theae TaxID=2171751 RepID=A0A2U1K727_9BACI|nr:DUF2626 domain-containing protein [Pueribacillus theae]PWA13341.1 DUF2626 domain-containing protein [Pueribacillus theae]